MPALNALELDSIYKVHKIHKVQVVPTRYSCYYMYLPGMCVIFHISNVAQISEFPYLFLKSWLPLSYCRILSSDKLSFFIVHCLPFYTLKSQSVPK